MLIRTTGLPLSWLESFPGLLPEDMSAGAARAGEVRQAFDEALHALPESPLRTTVYNARRDFFQRQKLPGRPAQLLWQENAGQPELGRLLEKLEVFRGFQVKEEAFDTQCQQAVRATFRLLQQVAREENLQRALLFASHDLLGRLPGFWEKPAEQFNKKDRQVAFALLQYLGRAAAKTSPLSRFTTVSVWRPAAEPVPEPEGPVDLFPVSKVVVTPNVALLPLLYEVLLHEPAFYTRLPLILNPGVADTGREDRGAGTPALSWLYFDGEQEAFQQMGNNPVATLVVKILLEDNRRMLFTALLARLEEDIDASRGELTRLILELVDIGLLEWELPEKGLSPGWCGALYNFLGFLSQQSPLVVEAAALLQWTRTTARTLPFQSIAGARECQIEAVGQWKVFLEKYGVAMPSVPPEQIFFEDVEEHVQVEVPKEIVATLAAELADCLEIGTVRAAPDFRSRLLAFAEEALMPDQSVRFTDFARAFLESAQSRQADREKGPHSGATGLRPSRIGALLQIYREEDGRYRAVVNGLFPGGGKLFARWLHLFPAAVSEQVKDWFDPQQAPFPWHGWSNANFQPLFPGRQLAVPGGRLFPSGAATIPLARLAVTRREAGIVLTDLETGETVSMTDLGLEAPDAKPPVMRILWHLGVPWVSLESLLPGQAWNRGGPGWLFRERTEHGLLVLSRKTWLVENTLTDAWQEKGRESDVFRRINADLRAMGIPNRYFAKTFGEKPQYFDRDNPLSVELLLRAIRRGKSPLVLTEMLPMPEQCTVKKAGVCAAEFVLELQV